MKVNIVREAPKPQPLPQITNVVLDLTPQEAHDLKVLALATEETWRQALASVPAEQVELSSGCKTYAAYKLRAALQEALKEVE